MYMVTNLLACVVETLRLTVTNPLTFPDLLIVQRAKREQEGNLFTLIS